MLEEKFRISREKSAKSYWKSMENRRSAQGLFSTA
jgi:hypothetical protein